MADAAQATRKEYTQAVRAALVAFKPKPLSDVFLSLFQVAAPAPAEPPLVEPPLVEPAVPPPAVPPAVPPPAVPPAVPPCTALWHVVRSNIVRRDHIMMATGIVTLIALLARASHIAFDIYEVNFLSLSGSCVNGTVVLPPGANPSSKPDNLETFCTYRDNFIIAYVFKLVALIFALIGVTVFSIKLVLFTNPIANAQVSEGREHRSLACCLQHCAPTVMLSYIELTSNWKLFWIILSGLTLIAAVLASALTEVFVNYTVDYLASDSVEQFFVTADVIYAFFGLMFLSSELLFSCYALLLLRIMESPRTVMEYNQQDRNIVNVTSESAYQYKFMITSNTMNNRVTKRFNCTHLLLLVTISLPAVIGGAAACIISFVLTIVIIVPVMVGYLLYSLATCLRRLCGGWPSSKWDESDKGKLSFVDSGHEAVMELENMAQIYFVPVVPADDQNNDNKCNLQRVAKVAGFLRLYEDIHGVLKIPLLMSIAYALSDTIASVILFAAQQWSDDYLRKSSYQLVLNVVVVFQVLIILGILCVSRSVRVAKLREQLPIAYLFKEVDIARFDEYSQRILNSYIELPFIGPLNTKRVVLIALSAIMAMAGVIIEFVVLAVQGKHISLISPTATPTPTTH